MRPEIKIPRRVAAAGVLATAMTVSLSPQFSADNNLFAAEPNNDRNSTSSETFAGSALDLEGLNSDVILNISVFMDKFDFGPGVRVAYESAPPDNLDGMFPGSTTEFINEYLQTDNRPVFPNDLAWEKVTTDSSGNSYLSVAKDKESSLPDFIEPGTFSSVSSFVDDGQGPRYTTDYMEFKLSDVDNIAQPIPEQYYALMGSALKIPDPEEVTQGFTTWEIGFSEESSKGSQIDYTVPYFALWFPNNERGYSVLALVNEQGNVHLLEAGPEIILSIIRNQGKLSDFVQIRQPIKFAAPKND